MFELIAVRPDSITPATKQTNNPALLPWVPAPVPYRVFAGITTLTYPVARATIRSLSWDMKSIYSDLSNIS
jgi:hypothetical protein